MASGNFPSRTIEITVISGENLQVRGKPIDSDLFVAVRSDLQNDSATTKIDRHGSAGFPRWNEKLVVDLPMHSAFLVVEVRRRASSGRKIKIVGTARVPVSDFTAGYVPENHLQFLSYRLRDGRGERNGIVNLSVRVKMAGGIDLSMLRKQGIGMPVPMTERKFHGGGGGGGGIVTGIPIWNVGYRDRF